MSKKKSNVDLKMKEVKFEYKEQSLTFSAEPYETLKNLKNRAIKRFIGIPKDHLLTCNGRDITHSQELQIGNLFRDKQKVIFRIKDKIVLPRMGGFNELSTKTSSTFLSNMQQGNVYQCHEKETQDLNICNKNIVPKLRMNLKGRGSKIKLMQNNILLPISMKNILTDRKYRNIPEINVNNLNHLTYPASPGFSSEPFLSLCEDCKTQGVSMYCRKCLKFSCENCSKKIEHQGHPMVHLDVKNVNNNVKIYTSILEADLEGNIGINQALISNKGKDKDIFQKMITKRQNIIKKLFLISEIYESTINLVLNHLTKLDNLTLEFVVKEYKIGAQDIIDKLETILSKNQDMELKNFEDLRVYFEVMSNYEKDIKRLNKPVQPFRLGYEIHSQMESLLDKIEKMLKAAIHDDTFLNLSDIYKKELNKAKCINVSPDTSFNRTIDGKEEDESLKNAASKFMNKINSNKDNLRKRNSKAYRNQIRNRSTMKKKTIKGQRKSILIELDNESEDYDIW